MRGAVLFAVLLGLLSGCDGESTPSASAPAAARPNADTPPKPSEPPAGDPVLLSVCAAWDEVAAEGGENPLMRAAVRAVETKGVTEAQLATLGARPQELLTSIRARGNPPACAAMVTALEAM